MASTQRSLRQQIKQHRVAIGVVGIVVVITLIIYGYWFDWTGFDGYNKVTIAHIISGTNAGTVTKTEEYQPGKGLWDWLGLLGVLAIPVVVGFGAVRYTRIQQLRDQEHEKLQHERDQEAANIQHDRDQQLADQRAESEQKDTEERARLEHEIASDNQCEAALQAYIDKMSELLLDKDLRKSKPEDEVRNVARTRTLTMLYRLNRERKNIVMDFLRESGLTTNEVGKSIVSFNRVFLNHIDLSRVNLSKTDFSEAELLEVNFNWAYLAEANFSGAVFVKSDLSFAILSFANLSGAKLGGAKLENTILGKANLSGANLKGATGITIEDLEKQAISLKGATMPDGSKHP